MVRSVDDAQDRTWDASRRESQGADSASREPADDTAPGTATAPHPLEPLLQQIAAIRDAATHYVESQKDLTTATIRRLVVKAIVAALAAIVGVTALVACTVMCASALAEVIGDVAGGRPWIGKLVVGGGFLVATATVAAVYSSKWMRSARAKTIQKYESRRDERRYESATNSGKDRPE